MTEMIKPYNEWLRRPSYHGSYQDYVTHMQAMERMDQGNSEERIASLVATKLRRRRSTVTE